MVAKPRLVIGMNQLQKSLPKKILKWQKNYKEQKNYKVKLQMKHSEYLRIYSAILIV